MRFLIAGAAFVASSGAAVVLSTAGGAATPTDASWTSFGANAQITAFTSAPAFTTKVKSFSLAWRASLDGAVIASPLAAPVPGRGLVVFASTEAGSVYALGPDGTVLWKRVFGSVVSNGGCGTYGVSSTPVVDLGRGLLYVANATGMVHGLRLADGSEAPGWPVRAVGRRRTEYVWGGLRLVGNRLYVPVASYCDAPDRRGVPAEGRLMAYSVDSPATMPAVFDPVPGMDNLGGIWGWGGVSATKNGQTLYTGVGDAEPDVANGASDSMVQLTADLSEVVASSRPPDAAPGQDADLGSAPVLFQPLGCSALLAADGKTGDLLIWRQNALGKGLYARIPLSDGLAAFVGAPSWSPRTQMLYVSGATALQAGKRVVGTMALAVTPKCGFVKRWFSATGDGSQPEPLVAGDLVASTGGARGGFVVQRAATGVVVWRYATSAPTLSSLIEAGGRMIGADSDGSVYAFRPVAGR